MKTLFIEAQKKPEDPRGSLHDGLRRLRHDSIPGRGRAENTVRHRPANHRRPAGDR